MITDNILLDLIDGKIIGEEASHLKSQIGNNPELSERFNQLKEVDNVLGDQPIKSPSFRFNELVIAGLSKKFESKSLERFWGKSLFIAIGLIAVGLISAIVLLSNYSLTDVLPTTTQEITIQQKTITFNPGEFINQDLFFKGLIYLNGFLGLFLLERAVFRPFFKHRRQRFSY